MALMQEAYPAWDEIERLSGVRVFTKVAAPAVGRPYAGSSATTHTEGTNPFVNLR